MTRYADSAYKKRRQLKNHCAAFRLNSQSRLLVVLGLQHLTTTIEAVWADMVTQMCFASSWLDCQWRRDEEIVCTMHTALRRGLFVLLNSHDNS
jgi:hypothetical protein